MAAAALVCNAECVCLCVCVCLCMLLSPGRAGQTGPVHMEPAPLVSFVVALGVFLIGACSVQYHAASSHSGSRIAACLFSFLPVSHSFFSASNFPPYLPYSQPSMSLFCLPNLLFFLHFSLSHSFPPPSPWPHCPFLSVCIHHLSRWIWLVFINRAL